jgi:hypothetical protein
MFPEAFLYVSGFEPLRSGRNLGALALSQEKKEEK